MNIVERISLIGSEKYKSVRAFEMAIGKSQGYIKTMEKRGGVPGTDVLIKIRELHPDIDVNWLLTGDGCMYLKEESDIVMEPEPKYSSSITINITDGESSDLIKALEKLIKRDKEI